jgi:hypothetical protein
MPIIPRSLRPMVVLRRQATRRGLRGNSRFWRWVAFLVYIRSDVARHAAIREGVFGKSLIWRAVAVVVFADQIMRTVLVKSPQKLGTERLVAGQAVHISSIAPVSRREQRRLRRAAS